MLAIHQLYRSGGGSPPRGQPRNSAHELWSFYLLYRIFIASAFQPHRHHAWALHRCSLHRQRSNPYRLPRGEGMPLGNTDTGGAPQRSPRRPIFLRQQAMLGYSPHSAYPEFRIGLPSNASSITLAGKVKWLSRYHCPPTSPLRLPHDKVGSRVLQLSMLTCT